MIDPEAVTAEAQRIVKSVSIAQVGDHHSMAEVSAMHEIDALEDPTLLYAVVKTFAATVADLAMYTADEMVGTDDRDRQESVAVEVIRRVVDGLEFRTQERPE